MRIDRIKLHNYKRFGVFEVGLDPQFNLFVGDNASGKTTILDAITVGLDSWFIGMKGVQGIGSIDQHEVHVVPYPHGDVVSFEKQFPSQVECEGVVMDRSICWSRELARDRGRTTTVGAKDLAAIAVEADDLVRQGKPSRYHSSARMEQSAFGMKHHRESAQARRSPSSNTRRALTAIATAPRLRFRRRTF